MNEVAQKPNQQPKPKSLMAAQKDYVTSIGRGLHDVIGGIDSYQAICGYNILAKINVLLAKEGLSFNSPNVDKETINNAIKYAIIYRLNTDNNEVFVIVRNEKHKDKDGKETWIKVVEVKPQYKGVLKILADYGRDVVKVYPTMIVRKTDGWKFPIWKGTNITPPEWEPHGCDGEVRLVCVPIQYKDGFIDYRIAERESVATNIKAQIKQSLMGKSNKEEILAKIQDMTLDELLTDKTVAPLVNETYTGISKEEMLITKLTLNAVKRVPIDYQSALARELNEKTFDNADVYVKNHNAEEILAQGNAPMLEEVKEVETQEEEKPKVDDDGIVVEPQPSDEDDDFYKLFEGDDE